MIARKTAALVAAVLFLAPTLPSSAADAQEPAPPACQFQASGEELVNRASPPDSASVQLGDGIAKVCYGSPRARGREIMGGLVPHGEPWRLGANEPTTLHLTFPAEIGDLSVQPGSYSLYAVPGRETWEVVVNGSTDRWGVPIDEDVRSEDLGSVKVDAGRTDSPVEELSITFERRSSGGAHLVVEWERTRIEVPVRRSGS